MKKLIRIPVSSLALLAVILGVTLFLYSTKAGCPTKEIAECRLIALRNTLMEFAVFVFFLAGLFIVRMKKVKNGSVLGLICVVIVVSIGWYNSSKFLPFSKKEHIYPSHPVISFLQTHAEEGRFLGLGSANIIPDIATQYRIYDPQYYDPLYIKRYGQLVAYANTGIPNSPLLRSDIEITKDILLQVDQNQRRNQLLDVLSVRYLIYKKSELPNQIQLPVVWEDDTWVIVERSTALSRYSVVHDVTIHKENLLPILFDPSFDVRRSVLLEKGEAIKLDNTIGSKDTLTIKYQQENETSLFAALGSPGFLVVSDSWYPGWNAYVDGVKTEVLRANYAMRAIRLPSGNHSVVMKYEPNSFTLGLSISVVAAIILVIAFVRFRNISFS